MNSSATAVFATSNSSSVKGSSVLYGIFGLMAAGFAVAMSPAAGNVLDWRTGFLGLAISVAFALANLFFPGRVRRPEGSLTLASLAILAAALLLSRSALLDLTLIGVSLAVAAVASHDGFRHLRLVAPFAAFGPLLLLAGSFQETEPLASAFGAFGLAFVLGLFPLAPWYGRLFERLPSAIIAGLVIVQITFITGFETLRPETSQAAHLVLVSLAILSSLVALSRADARRALAGLMGSQLALLAYAQALTPELAKSDVILASAMMIALPGLLLAIGALEARRGRLSLSRPSGSFESTPRLANTIPLFGLLSAGFPLSLTYVGEDLILQSGFASEPVIIVGWAVVIALNAIMAIKLFLFLCHGSAEKQRGIDLQPAKYWAACSAIAALFFASFVVG
ncbi:proton-conducting transporter transmembrane domain-containing protein [Parvularcula lutaonensis]|uniref:Proton-conducting transporter membrane subunit n=1 Tax=Parvularcula lutaonensis TaxID=491923 RepID=A0ABV7ME41_9PROT|nr:proton-conducting transporter membrane subunit [Parvularcula lutaonensis]GGY52903.1 hypothetical protein GCM10007148_22650 [Parvularcula lutaonensis]